MITGKFPGQRLEGCTRTDCSGEDREAGEDHKIGFP